MGEPNRRRIIEAAYSTSLACPSQLFVGREEQLNAYIESVPAPRIEPLPPQPVSLAFIGPWGIGKTSILRYLLDNESKDDFLITEIVTDFKSIDELLALALKNIALSVSRRERLKQYVNKLAEAGISPLRVPSSIKGDRSRLTDILVDVWGVLERGGVKHCSLAIDDFHLLSPDDMLTMRNIFQALPNNGCNYSLVVTSTPDPFVKPLTEPVSRFFKEKKHVRPFTKKEAGEAIQKPIDVVGIDLSFDGQYLDDLMDWTLGYPYFIKFITGELAVRYKKLTGGCIKKHEKELFGALGDAKFRDDFSRAPGENGKRILMRMAKLQADGKERPRKFRASEFKDVEQYTSYLDMLLDKGLINRDERGVYSAYHSLFLEWLRVFEPQTKSKGGKT